MSSLMNPETSKTDCKLTCDFEILRRAPVFSGADSEVVKLFAYLAQRKKFNRNDVIIQPGSEAGEAFLLLSGSAEVTASHRNRDVVVQVLKPQTLFGELALLARFKWFFTVRALEQSEAMVISRESFRKVLENFPRRREQIIEKIVQLRVQKLVEQTAFLLDKVPDTLSASLVEEGGPTF